LFLGAGGAVEFFEVSGFGGVGVRGGRFLRVAGGNSVL
jgi:hypothetical protein